jgi:hypothetical protein
MHGTIGASGNLGDILERIEGELRMVAATIERVEPHLAQVDGQGENAAERTRALQEIDLALQSIHGLADFCGSLAQTLPGDCPVETATALNVIKLAAMKQRLQAGVETTPETGIKSRARAVGDIEFF